MRGWWRISDRRPPIETLLGILRGLWTIRATAQITSVGERVLYCLSYTDALGARLEQGHDLGYEWSETGGGKDRHLGSISELFVYSLETVSSSKRPDS